jgi:hypothetical protein
MILWGEAKMPHAAKNNIMSAGEANLDNNNINSTTASSLK